jgi:nucleoside-triphosphatase THEP1
MKLLLFHPFMNYFIRKMKKRLNKMKRKFAAVVEEEKAYSTLVICDQTSLNGDQGSKIDDQIGDRTSTIGGDEQAEKIEGLLLGGAENEFTAIGIVGIAGVGKTTLVHQVLNREKVRDKFSPIIWLSLSDIIKEKQEVTNSISISIVTRILDKLGAMANGNGATAIDNGNDVIVVEEESDISSPGLERLLDRLNRLLSGTRYLIVLDDVWHISEFYSSLGCTCRDSLSHGLPKASGGAVIVTTRIPQVAQHMVGRNNLIHVEPLDRESCWRIFRETIKDNNTVLYMSTDETLEKIKNEIKDQCYGLPLAAKELAGIIPKRIREIEYSSQLFLTS